MSKTLFTAYFVIWYFLIVIGGNAQGQKIDTITNSFKNYRQQAFTEKLFLHLDQSFYLTGETLWFRVFAVDGTLHKPSSISKVAYVELLDKNSKQVIQTKVSIDENGGNGSIFIPATLLTGNYVLRAYTNWMKNYNAAYFFHQEITVLNPFVRPEFESKEGSVSLPKVEFFPEGGYLVEGIRSKVGFKIYNTVSSSATALILKNESDTVARLTPNQFNIGSFYFTPEMGSTYKCIITTSLGLTSHSLPVVKSEGYVMQVIDSSSEYLQIRVVLKQPRTNSLPYVYLLAHCRNSLIKAEVKPVYPEEALFVLDRKTLPGGVTHLTVFDEKLQPVCERLYFKAPSERLDIGVEFDQKSYTTRRKVAVALTTESSGGKAPADLSIAVFRMDSLSSVSESDVRSYLYLTSDLSGKVENPAFYFSGSVEAKGAADNLMLTHGWRRFKWDNVIGRKSNITFVPETRSHLVSGKVLRQDNTPAQGVLTYLSSPGKLVNLYGALSDRNGNVRFEVKDFWGSRQLIFQTNTNVDSTLRLSINDPYSNETLPFKTSPLNLAPLLTKRLSERALSMQVQDIYYRDVLDRVSAVKNDSSAFFGRPDEKYNLDDYTRFPVMEEVMREYVAGVLVRKRRDGFHFAVVNRKTNTMLEGEPLVLLDGVPVFDADKIMAFDPLRVKRLELIASNFYVGPLALSGIVSYSTYNGDLGGFPLDPKSIDVDYEGLQLQREYYNPRYENQNQRNTKMPDQRTLLHWVPQLKTDAQGKAGLDFYTSDVTGDFIVVVEGLTASGIPGSSARVFSVKATDY